MKIEDKKVVRIEYTLKGDDGETLDSSDGREPLTYLQGAKNLVPGLEKALAGKAAGDTLDVKVTPEDGYGQRDDRMVQRMPVRKLPNKDAKVGMRFRVNTEAGPGFLLVTSVKGDYATVDANHPLAGMNLNFSVKVVDVRDATAEEIEHQHVHGDGGHQH